MKKKIALFITVLTLALSCTAFAASGTTYTFKGNNVITDGSPNDITDVALTKDIIVTTSGNMNRKYVGITDLKHNNEVGTFPANDKFKATGSYLYLGCANANDGSIITLQIPEIKKGSKVTLTFAKPTVTNNGSTLRNTNDPYAYLKIADRYISINGDNFDTWRTESVVTGEDTNEIVFYADKWGAVAISKIEIKEGDNAPLHSINISSTQYANLTVNGIKFCADENGQITLASYPENEFVTIKAEKDGYVPAETSTTIANADANVDIPLACETDAAYYESEFGNASGTLALDGEFVFPGGIYTEDVTKVFGRLTFTDSGYMTVQTAKLTYNGDGIYLNDEKVTSKDNMEFELYFDKSRKLIFLKQNDEYTKIENADTEFDTIKAIEGKNVTIEYIGITYPDTTKIKIDGHKKLPSLPGSGMFTLYDITPEYNPPVELEMTVSVTSDNSDLQLEFNDRGRFEYPAGASGHATLTVTQGEATGSIEVEFVQNPRVISWKHDGGALNLGASKQFEIYSVKDENGTFPKGVINDCLKDFKSSDESVLRIDQNGMMTAVGKGRATITANIYTGIDNPISVDYTVDTFYIDGVVENDISYASGDFIDDQNITSYQITYCDDGVTEAIEKTQIPASSVKENGLVVNAYYAEDGMLYEVRNRRVKKGDKVPASNGNKKVYLMTDSEITELKETDTTMDGYEIHHKSGQRYEIAPVYTFNDIGDVSEGKILDAVFDSGLYNITFKKAETRRGDIYVNGFMVGNNVDQADADRKVTDGALYTAEDIRVKNGEIMVSMTDGSTLLDYVIVEKKPKFYSDFAGSLARWMYGGIRPSRVYVIGDSLACNYYGDFEQEVGGGRTGWGQVLENYITIPVTNLANSGQYAKGLYDTAFPSVIENGEYGDICLIEVGYNDRSYSTRDEMTETVKAMVAECRKKGITPILITPNASAHDYKPSVSWSSYLRDAAVDTECDLIDLSQLSYDFLYSLYGDDADGNITKNYNLTEVGGDTLHSSYAAAQRWASIVAQELKNMWPNAGIYNTEYEYTFTDTLGNKITARVE